MALAESMGPRWDDARVFVLTDNGLLSVEHGTTGKSIWWDDATRVPLRAQVLEAIETTQLRQRPDFVIMRHVEGWHDLAPLLPQWSSGHRRLDTGRGPLFLLTI